MEAEPMKLQIVPLRGRDKGRFGWVLLVKDELLIQCLRTFPSSDAAQDDAAKFLEQDPSEWARLH